MEALKIIDNVLEPVEYIIPFSLANKTINILVKAPINSSVFLTTNINGKYVIPMYFKEQTADGNIFTCDLALLNHQINYLKQRPKTILVFSISINNTKIEGEFKGSIHPQLYNSFLKEINTVKQLQDKIIELESKIAIMKVSAPGFKVPEQTLYKGMVPMSTGVYNEFIWDFPFSDLRAKVLELSGLVLNLSTQNTQLTERINTLEQKVNEHIYEQYQL